MRFYLDTNILAFLRLNQLSDLSSDVRTLIEDYSTILYTSTVCVHELIHLCQIGKLRMNKKDDYSEASNVLKWLHSIDVCIIPISELHLQKFSNLPLYKDHTDPFDRLIVAQAICDRIPLVSSDHKFLLYKRDGLDFVFNKR